MPITFYSNPSEKQKKELQERNERRSLFRDFVYNPNQPRDPKGSETGGEWTKAGGTGRKITDTPEFKKWFGNSKVVDKDGKPLVVYHGTKADFVSFNEDSFFTEQRDYAGEISLGRFWDASPTDGAKVIPVYLSIENPYFYSMGEDEFSIPSKEIPIIKKAKQKGYDGIIFTRELNGERFFVAFSPTQIKSTANSGTFDRNNPNILLSSRK